MRSMPVIFQLQVLSVGFTAICIWLMPSSVRLNFVFAFGFSHYLLAFIYSRAHLKSTLSSVSGFLLLAALIAASTGLYAGAVSLMIYFGIHHALSESYAPWRGVNGEKNETLPCLRGLRFCFHLAAYFLIVEGRGILDQQLVAAGLVLALLFSFLLPFYWCRQRGLRFSGFESEWLLLLLVPLAFVVDIRFTDVVLYHFFYWALLPLPKLAAVPARNRTLGIYLGLTVLSLGSFLLVSPMFYRPTFTWTATYADWFYFFSYLHITTAFALSRSNPDWINNLFALRWRST